MAKVLLVEDKIIIARMYEQAFKRGGCDVRVVPLEDESVCMSRDSFIYCFREVKQGV